MPDPTPEQQRAALEKAARAICCKEPCNKPIWFDLCTAVSEERDKARTAIATYLAATGREAEAEQVRRAGDG